MYNYRIFKPYGSQKTRKDRVVVPGWPLFWRPLMMMLMIMMAMTVLDALSGIDNNTWLLVGGWCTFLFVSLSSHYLKLRSTATAVTAGRRPEWCISSSSGRGGHAAQ
jgi:hypothetical protein